MKAALACILLAALDLAGAYCAKEAADRHSMFYAALGVGLFVALFGVYMLALRYADLAPVTLGWIVILQLGVVLLDARVYQTPMTLAQYLGCGIAIGGLAIVLTSSAGAT